MRAARSAGIITDGDLRRLMQQRRGEVLELTAGECVSANPVTIAGDEFASAALRLMEQRKITSRGRAGWRAARGRRGALARSVDAGAFLVYRIRKSPPR